MGKEERPLMPLPAPLLLPLPEGKGRPPVTTAALGPVGTAWGEEGQQRGRVKWQSYTGLSYSEEKSGRREGGEERWLPLLAIPLLSPLPPGLMLLSRMSMLIEEDERERERVWCAMQEGCPFKAVSEWSLRRCPACASGSVCCLAPLPPCYQPRLTVYAPPPPPPLSL